MVLKSKRIWQAYGNSKRLAFAMAVIHAIVEEMNAS
jgi:hypothetical protein